MNPAHISKTISSRINSILESRGLSRYDLHQMTNIPYATIKRITQPENENIPRLDTLYTIAETFGVSVDFLIGATDERIPKFDDGMTDLIKIYPVASKEDRDIISMILRKYAEEK